MQQFFFPVLIFLMTLFDCSGKRNINYQLQGYDSRVLRDGWDASDTAIVRKWITGLKDQHITTPNFYTMVATLSSISGFHFGNIDISENTWQRYTPLESRCLRYNIARAYELYRQSCLFLRRDMIDEYDLKEELETLQDKFCFDHRKMNEKEEQEIAKAMAACCEKLKKNNH